MSLTIFEAAGVVQRPSSQSHPTKPTKTIFGNNYEPTPSKNAAIHAFPLPSGMMSAFSDGVSSLPTHKSTFSMALI